MSKAFRLFVGMGLALIAPSTGTMAADAVVPVSVDSTADVLTVKVTGPVSLREVLGVLCERTEASCKLPAALPDTRVQPRTIQGSWSDVVADLLHGSDLSFAVTPPVPGRNAYLVVEPAATAIRDKQVSGDSASSAAGAGVTGGEAPGEAPPAEAEAAPEEAQPAVESSNDTPAAAPALSPDSPLVSATTAAATPGVNFAMTPFADANGNPLLSRVGPVGGSGSQAPAGMATLPYSDEFGNPIMVPITNEPLSLTPFTGPDGQPWPAPVPQPNQKLEYPIPPTYPPASKPDHQ